MTAADLTTEDILAEGDTDPGFCRACGEERDIIRKGTTARLCASVRFTWTNAACAVCESDRVLVCDGDTAARLASAAEDRRFAFSIGREARGWWRHGQAPRAEIAWEALRLAWRNHDPEAHCLETAYSAALVALDAEDAAQ
jgi:hypothetical protein